MCTGPRQGSPRCTLASPPPRHTSLQTIVNINQYPCYPLTIMVTQGEYLGESFPEADRAASLEEGAHLLGEPLPLSVQEDAHTGLPTSPSSSHLCVIKIFNISKSLACLIWPIACATPTIERVWRVHVQSTYYSGKVTKNFVLLLPLLVAPAYSSPHLLIN